MAKIALAGIVYHRGVGDRLLLECAEYLCKKRFGDQTEFSYIDFFGRRQIPQKQTGGSKKRKSRKELIENKIWKLGVKLGGDPVRNLMYKRQYQQFFASPGTTVYMKEYFEERLKDVDMLIFYGGGMIKYDALIDCGKYVKRISDAAKIRNIPVAVLGFGIENTYNDKDARSRFFSKTLSDDIFKIVTTRDRLDDLKKYVRNPDTVTKAVADAGVWSAELYGIRKDDKAKKIGIGIIDSSRFVDLKTGITADEYDRMIVEIIRKLEARGEEVVIFNNGAYVDQAYAEHISALAGKSKTEIITPDSPEDIVRIISGFKGIITSRLHSCIPAYSLDVPFVALCWNIKLKYFAEKINIPERIIDKDRFSSDVIISEFYKALENGYDSGLREAYKQTDIEFMDLCAKWLA